MTEQELITVFQLVLGILGVLTVGGFLIYVYKKLSRKG